MAYTPEHAHNITEVTKC